MNTSDLPEPVRKAVEELATEPAETRRACLLEESARRSDRAALVMRAGEVAWANELNLLAIAFASAADRIAPRDSPRITPTLGAPAMEPVHVHFEHGGYAVETPDPTITVGEYINAFGISRQFEGIFELRRDGITYGLDDPIVTLSGLHVSLVRVDAEPDELAPGQVAFAVLDAADPNPATDDYPDGGTVDQILAWVGTDPDRAQVALEAEIAGKNRKGLVEPLSAVLDAADPNPAT